MNKGISAMRMAAALFDIASFTREIHWADQWMSRPTTEPKRARVPGEPRNLSREQERRRRQIARRDTP